MKRSLRCSMRLHRNGTILGLIVMGASVGVAARAQTAPAQKAPVFTSGASATFTVGTPGTFPVAANGDPAPVIGLKSQDPHLPPSIQFDRASGTLGGTPRVGDEGIYKLVFSATSGGSQETDQSVTLTVEDSDVLAGMGFGAALGFQYNVFHKAPIVSSATIDANGIVRVNTRANATVGFMLETHYLYVPQSFLGIKTPNKLFGWGPFVGVVPGGQNLISAAGAGLMFAWRHDATARQGFGLGVGYESIPAAQTLGDEFVDGKPAPLGPDGKTPLPLRYETRDKGSLLVIFSVVF